MKSPSVYSRVRRTASLISVLVLLIPSAIITRANPTPQNSSFSIPQWTSLRIRMDDTLTSKYSMEGDPFSATVMDDGMYQGARVYGTIQTIDNSGRFRGHTTMVLVFNRLMMPDGQRAPISAEIVKLYHAPSGEFVDVEGAIESAAAENPLSFTQRSVQARGHCLVEFSAAAKAQESARLSVAQAASAPQPSPAPKTSASTAA